jgi:hypothetical protein
MGILIIKSSIVKEKVLVKKLYGKMRQLCDQGGVMDNKFRILAVSLTAPYCTRIDLKNSFRSFPTAFP